MFCGEKQAGTKPLCVKNSPCGYSVAARGIFRHTKRIGKSLSDVFPRGLRRRLGYGLRGVFGSVEFLYRFDEALGGKDEDARCDGDNDIGKDVSRLIAEAV